RRGLRHGRGDVRVRPAAHRGAQRVLRPRAAQGGRVMTLTNARPARPTAPPAPPRERSPRRRRPDRGRLLASVVGLVVAVLWVFPVYRRWRSALLPNRLLQSFAANFLPTGGSLENFRAVLAGGGFLSALGMSLSTTLLAVTACLLFAFLAALAISRYRFPARTSFVVPVLLDHIPPAEGLFIAQSGRAALVVPFTVWMLRGFVAGIPAELEEAAMVDGLSRTRAFFRITFPLLAPGLVASGVYAFLQCWNEFTIALVILQREENKTLPLW